MTVAGIVVAVIVVVGLIQAAIWIPVTRRSKRTSASFLEQFRDDVARSGERVIVEPERGVYRGGSGSYSAVSGNGTILLTDRRLLFRKKTGGEVEVPTASMVSATRSKGFRGSRVGGATHLVITTSDGAEVGFFVDDLDAWDQALASLIHPSPKPDPHPAFVRYARSVFEPLERAVRRPSGRRAVETGVRF